MRYSACASFFANDHEPIHVHVENGDGEIKIQVSPSVELIENRGMKQKDIKKAIGIADLYKEDIIESLHKFFTK